jgi:hypothetical protein
MNSGFELKSEVLLHGRPVQLVFRSKFCGERWKNSAPADFGHGTGPGK